MQTNTHDCRSWATGDPLMEHYHDHEWCRPNHNDAFQFEMLCLEGASVGLSWRTILHKREAYRAAFAGFDIAQCASLSDSYLNVLLQNDGIVRNRNKIRSVRTNAQVVQAIQAELGSFDAYLWGFAGGRQVCGRWKSLADVPTQSDLSCAVSADLKRRGASFVGPTITYSFLQSIGIVNDHLATCPCFEPCRQARGGA